MTQKEFNCNKICKNSCASLQEALRKETATVTFYENMMDECNSPEISEFLSGIIESRRSEMLKIIQKLNEVQARSQIVDGVISSFDSES
ncbi:hypothetical protein MASR1M107_26420 [Ignavibacteriales bacterium]